MWWRRVVEAGKRTAFPHHSRKNCEYVLHFATLCNNFGVTVFSAKFGVFAAFLVAFRTLWGARGRGFKSRQPDFDFSTALCLCGNQFHNKAWTMALRSFKSDRLHALLVMLGRFMLR
jgi:hypothetical protein